MHFQTSQKLDKNMKRETLSVLILEPNALQCDLIKLALIRHHMNPIICKQPDSLRQQLAEHLPDVLLVDTYLPGQNGLDLIGQLNSEVLLKRTKVFFISSLAFPEIVQKAAKMGASGFLVKPLNPDLLVTRILNSLGRSAQVSGKFARIRENIVPVAY
jgi:PleD family two-component response regulator